MNISTPIDTENLVKLPYSNNVFLCSETFHRWIRTEKAGEVGWERDYYGEADWEKMASYVSKTYEEVAKQELHYALNGNSVS